MAVNFLTSRLQANTCLVLCPHPDDFDVIAISLRALGKTGSDIYTAVAPTSSGILDEFFDSSGEVTDENRIATRIQEQLDSLKFFGLPGDRIEIYPETLDLDENGELCQSDRNRALIEATISRVCPDRIFLPHPNDHNPAHSAMYDMVCVALAGLNLTVDLYKHMDPKTKGINLQYFTPFDQADFEWKAEMLKIHKSQHHRNLTTRSIGFDERVLQSNRQIAEKHNLPCEYAEAFELEAI